MNLKLQNLKVIFPKEIKNFTESELVEWLEFNLGLRGDIKLSNPLIDTEIRDCDVSCETASIDGKPIKL